MQAAEKQGDQGEEPEMIGVLRAAIAAAVAGGQSLREVARKSGVHWGGVLRFAKGERDITFTSAARLADALGLVLAKRKGRKK
jgi:DNA-binding phage protein